MSQKWKVRVPSSGGWKGQPMLRQNGECITYRAVEATKKRRKKVRK